MLGAAGGRLGGGAGTLRVGIKHVIQGEGESSVSCSIGVLPRPLPPALAGSPTLLPSGSPDFQKQQVAKVEVQQDASLFHCILYIIHYIT